MSDLMNLYHRIKPDIESRLEEFRALWREGSDSDLFAELCFCICTPQNDAHKAFSAVTRLKESGLLEHGELERIAALLQANGVRFHNHKAASIIKNRSTFFPQTKAQIAKIIQGGGRICVRDELAAQVSGWGLKEASHFLRNTGHGEGICILDRHILRQLAGYAVIAAVPQNLTKRLYWSIEQAMIHFAGKEEIPVDALDLLLWYKEKNELFR
ncbi:MAG: N-glycosylase/DNA lyase [Spirochaetaceae bacterium]|jgi:N-glycosylase/DNA lyase|nr:N-glycosylase/DNA lyase [Spirochaetaceae bacterium]